MHMGDRGENITLATRFSHVNSGVRNMAAAIFSCNFIPDNLHIVCSSCNIITFDPFFIMRKKENWD